MQEELDKEIGLGRCIWKMHASPGYEHPWGKLGISARLEKA